jgi:16S rRNA (guanine(1405)-N(7))-methyltransferase
LTKGCHARALSLIRAYDGTDIYADKGFTAKIFSLHASTSERAAQAGAIYDMIGRSIKPGDALADIGCGFNPFSLPYLKNRPARYMAYDLCKRTIDLINEYFKPFSPAYNARLLDAATQNPDAGADVVLMLKLFPLLERQKKGRAFEILNTYGYREAIVSFPTKSASGRDVGMEAFYTDLFLRDIPADIKIVDKTVFENEIFFIISKNSKK